MEAEGALGRGGCKACWDLSHTGRWGGGSDGASFLPPPAILCCLSFFFFFYFILFPLFIFLGGLCWVFIAACGPSLVAASGGHSSSWRAGLSLR